ncbi:MAG: hypothetical protein ABIY71_07920, partial [Flavobacteriales bacterium]
HLVTIVTKRPVNSPTFAGIMVKDTKLYSILNFKCPYCHEGDFFVAHPYNLKRVGDLHDRCSECNGRYTIEPGFYYGAMYVSYAMGTALAVSIWVAFLVLAPDAPLPWIIGVVSIVMIGVGPLFYALSKIIWANMFLDFENPKGTHRSVD